MELQDLQRSISQMSDAELLERLKDIRANRRINKRPEATTKKAKPQKEASLDTILASLGKDAIAKMIAELGGKK